MEGAGDDRFFAFVQPPQLQIVASQPQTHKQILTLYNPYQFPIRFKVKCTNPKVYSVLQPRGILKENCSIDIIIRHAAAQARTSLGFDTFRIEVCPVHNKKLVGSKDIPVHIVEFVPPENQLRYDPSHPTTSTSSTGRPFLDANRNSVESSALRPVPSVQTYFEQHSSAFWLCVGVAVICAAALMLPTQGLDNASTTTIPDWLHLSVPQKLVFAYVLGLVTLLVLRPG